MSEPTNLPENRRGRRSSSPVITPTAPLTQKAGNVLSRRDRRLIVITVGSTIAAGIFHSSGGNQIISFVVTAFALAVMASLVGRSVEALGDRLGPGPTGLLQSFLGNVPELFVVLFSLKAGLYTVAKATIVGSILANVLLILGAAFIVGGLKNGRQYFNQVASRQLAVLLALSVFALAIPTLTFALDTPAATHERGITIGVSILLLLLFASSLPDTLRKDNPDNVVSGSDAALAAKSDAHIHGDWPLGLAIGMLALTGVGAAFVSEWFVSALSPAITALHISEAFAGLIIVAIAGNAVENVVGIKLAARGQADYALQIILQSPVQVAMTIAPIVALAAPLVGAGTFTLVLSPLLLAVLFMATLTTIIIVVDGDYTWFEGVALIALYLAIALAFWWG
ncbi:MAG: sodium:proton exchanger [Actinomycetes bacterium]